MLPQQASSVARYLPFSNMNQFFDDIPQNVMLVGTAMAICGVVYSILTLSVYLFVQNAVLAAATYHAYKELCEAACMRDNLERLDSANTDLERVNTELSAIQVDFHSGVQTLGQFQGKLDQLREQIAGETRRLQEANVQYIELNRLNRDLHRRYEALYHRWESLTGRFS